MVFSELKNSFRSLKQSPIAIRVLLYILFVSFFVKAFVYATTNSLRNADVSDLLQPIHHFLFYIFIVSGFGVFIYYSLKKQLYNYFIAGSFLLTLITAVLLLYQYAPCLIHHSPSFEDHVHPHSVAFTLKRSFLCPSYSTFSNLTLGFFFTVGIFTFTFALISKRYNE